MEKYQGMVFSQCLKFFRSQEEAEDLSQEIFLKAFESLSTFKGESQFSTWLYKLAQNLILSKNRKKSIKVESVADYSKIDTADNIDSNHVETESLRKEYTLKMQKLLSMLPANYKQPIILYYFENMSYREIADRLNLKINTLKSHILRGKEILKNWLQNEKES
jgi:RNA polymerase sigma-70 factor (ECF subfamily)